jgi:hypothetical protein
MIERKGRELAMASWDEFREQMRGRPIDEIRTALFERFDAEWPDEKLVALRDGGPITVKMVIKP